MSRTSDIALYPRAVPVPVDLSWLWFGAALVPMLIGQTLRVQYQDNPVGWLACDYGWRLGSLAVLLAIPAARRVAFQREKLKVRIWIVIVGIVLAMPFDLWAIVVPIDRAAGRLLGIPTDAWWLKPLSNAPALHGYFRLIDILVGLPLIVFTEEVLFRRCARRVLSAHLGDGAAMIIVSSILFGAIHWSTHNPISMITAGATGLALMLAYRRVGALWPTVLAHYWIDAAHL